MTAVDHKGKRICFVDAQGLHTLRTKCSKWGYEITSIKEADKAGYVVTMMKVKKLVHYAQIETKK